MKQITTSVGFQDAKGTAVANGSLSLTLSQNAEITATGGQVTTEPLYFPLDATGKISPTNILFSDELTPSGTVYKAILYASNGMRIIQDFGYWSITGASADLSTMIPTSIGGASAAGVVLLAPTSNQVIVQPSGTNLSVNRFENIRFADQFTGADIGAKVNAAFADLAGSPGTIVIPPGTYTYSTDIIITSACTLMGYEGTILNYSGSGNAVKMGSDGLVASDPDPYTVTGIEFTGGASMAQGIYFNTFITHPEVFNCYFKNFGNSTAYAIFAQAQNWYTHIIDNVFIDTDTTARNKVRIRGKSVASVSDNGNSQLFFVDNVMTAPVQLGASNAAGVGVWVTGTGSVILGNKIEGFAPNIRMAPKCARLTVSNNYLEEINNTACIEFGDPAAGDDPSNFPNDLVVAYNYCNMHNADGVFNTTSSFIGFTAGNTAPGLQNARVINNTLANVGAAVPLIQLNNVASQTGNQASGNHGHTLLHTAGGSITAWGGTDENLAITGLMTATNGNFGNGTVSVPAITAGSTGIGFWNNGGGHLEYASGGASNFGFFSSLFQLKSSGAVAFSGGAVNAASATQISQASAGVISIDTTATGNSLGQIVLNQVTEQTANGGQWIQGQASELLTLSTVGATTDTTANLLPANAIIESVVARVTTTITTATDWKLGDAATAGRFAAANATMTAGATSIGTVQADQTGAPGPRQASAAKVRVTTTGTPGAGVIRITVFYRQFVAPTS